MALRQAFECLRFQFVGASPVGSNQTLATSLYGQPFALRRDREFVFRVGWMGRLIGGFPLAYISLLPQTLTCLTRRSGRKITE